MRAEIQTRPTAAEPVPRVPIDAAACVRDGWRRTRDRYGALLGITLLGMFVGSLAPLGILTGPTMCGIHLCYLNVRDGRPFGLDTLFEGFEHFVPSLVATLLTMAVFMVVSVPFAAVTGALAAWLILPMGRSVSEQTVWIALYVWLGLFAAVIVALLNIVFFFMFAYLLIVDRGLGGGAAVRTSIRVAAANLAGLVRVAVRVSVLPVIAMLVVAAAVVAVAGFDLKTEAVVAVLWCVIAILALPPIFGALTEAYRVLYPARDIGGV